VILDFRGVLATASFGVFCDVYSSHDVVVYLAHQSFLKRKSLGLGAECHFLTSEAGDQNKNKIFDLHRNSSFKLERILIKLELQTS
jgi:hypothetical protein